MNLQEALAFVGLKPDESNFIEAIEAAGVIQAAARSVVEGGEPDYEAAARNLVQLLHEVPDDEIEDDWLYSMDDDVKEGWLKWAKLTVDAAVKGRRLVEWEDTKDSQQTVGM